VIVYQKQSLHLEDCSWITKNNAAAIGGGCGFRLVKDLVCSKLYPGLSIARQSSRPAKGNSNFVKVQRRIVTSKTECMVESFLFENPYHEH
jgi:hypothetical protein